MPSRPLTSLILAFAVGAICILVRPAQAADTTRPAAAADAPGDIPSELKEAIKSLATADDDGRLKIYDLLGVKGDARLIPAVTAWMDGTLQNRDGHLVIYGKASRYQGGQPGDNLKSYPIVDAFTQAPVVGPDGQPVFFIAPTIVLSAPGMMRLKKRQERKPVSELISTLALLDPDPAVRLASIRDAGERSAHVFIDPDDQSRFSQAMERCVVVLKAWGADPKHAADPASMKEAASSVLTAIDAALAEKPTKLLQPVPSDLSVSKIASALKTYLAAIPEPPTAPAATTRPAAATPTTAPAAPVDTYAFLRENAQSSAAETETYKGRLATVGKNLEDLPRYAAALKRQLSTEAGGRFGPALKEATAETDAILGSRPEQMEAFKALGSIGTSRAANLLRKVVAAAQRIGDTELENAASPPLQAAEAYQSRIRFAQNTFAGLSAGSILVLLALGLSIVFGLMGVINMAHGEFMMVGAFTTFVVASFFKQHFPGAYDYYLIAAVPAAFIVSALIGLLCEWVVIRHLYGRPLETLLATLGIGLILVQRVRDSFGDTLTVSPPSWMEGGWEIMPDLFFARNRLYIILYCAMCIAVVYYLVNRTKLGLLLRATTQNRGMASALGVPTRRIDAITFALGAGLAGLAGVAVPLYNKINPQIGQEYIVESFMVVVVGGVGALSGAIWAGLALGFLGKYLEPLLAMIPALASGSSVLGRVFVLVAVIVFLNYRPQGLFPPKGRLADA